MRDKAGARPSLASTQVTRTTRGVWHAETELMKQRRELLQGQRHIKSAKRELNEGPKLREMVGMGLGHDLKRMYEVCMAGARVWGGGSNNSQGSGQE